jgi:hypothetical protein
MPLVTRISPDRSADARTGTFSVSARNGKGKHKQQEANTTAAMPMKESRCRPYFTAGLSQELCMTNNQISLKLVTVTDRCVR